MRYLPMRRPIRTRFMYNNLMFTAASHLVESATRQPFADLLTSRFFRPLGMKRTFLGLSRGSADLKVADAADVAQGCYWDSESSTFRLLPDINAPDGQGAGNFMSSAREWALWIHAWIHESLPDISDASVAEMVRPHILSSDDQKYIRRGQSELFYGLGLYVEYYRGHKVISHSGGVPGFTSYMTWIPSRKWGCVLFGNSGGMYRAAQVISWSLIDQLLEVQEDDRTDWLAEMRKDIADEAKEEAEQEAKVDHGLFPDRADPPLSMPLPLEAYAGEYNHPAYGNLTLTIRDGAPNADASDRAFGFALSWKHVSGGHFVVTRVNMPNDGSARSMIEGAFEIGVDGRVRRMGLDLREHEDDNEDQVAPDHVWFDRVETMSSS